MNKLSSIIKYHIPEFVRVKHPKFTQLIEDYYKHLEQKGNYLYSLENSIRNLDIQQCDEEYLDKWFDENAENFPKNNLIDKRLLLHILHEFYLAKGSEDSFRFLFRILYNEDIEFFYPKKYLFKLSDGNYSKDTFIFITSNNFHKVKGEISIDAAITVESINADGKANINRIEEIIYIGTKYVLKLNVSDYSGTFIPDEDVYLNVNNEQILENIYGVLSSIEISNGGKNYKINDEISETSSDNIIPADFKISNISDGNFKSVNVINGGTGYTSNDEIIIDKQNNYRNGTSFNAIIKEVDEVTGEILQIEILSSGYNYDTIPGLKIISETGSGAQLELISDTIGIIKEIEVINPGLGYTNIDIEIISDNGTGVILNPVISCVFNNKEHYRNEKGFLSSIMKLHDSYYYQTFSYDIYSSIPFYKWKDIIKNNVHPSGYIMFGSLIIENEHNMNYLGVEQEQADSEIFIPDENYIAYSISNQYPDSINTDIIRELLIKICMASKETSYLDEVKFTIIDPISDYFGLTFNELYCGESSEGYLTELTQESYP